MQHVAGATGKRFDELGGRRLQTRLGGAKLCLGRAGRICPDLCASRLVRSTATHCDGPLDLEPNPPRQNGSNLRLDALVFDDANGCRVGPRCRDNAFRVFVKASRAGVRVEHVEPAFVEPPDRRIAVDNVLL